MANIEYIKICDYIMKNPKKSTKNCKIDLVEILKLNSVEEVEGILKDMINNQVIKEKKIKWRGMFYPIYQVNLTKLDTISRQNLIRI